MVDPVPNTGPMKFVPLGIGLAGGLAASVGIRAALVEPDGAAELRERGIRTTDSRQVGVYAMAIPFSVAAGIGLGLQKRSPTAGFMTTSQIMTAAVLSTVAGAMINSASDKAGDYVVGIGAAAAAVGAGALIGVRDEVPLNRARIAGLGLTGAAIGVAAPIILDTLSGTGESIRNGISHREP